jgi:glycine/D-amino acid oxidase-like deaminating enzyme/nitrite reductase/ring-hydroxylating ferredoxin subunit
MNDTHDAGSMETVSLWMATKKVPTFEPLTKSTRADVCIVGAGIAGLTTAYLLTKRGKKVIVVDDGPILSGETRRTTAHITNAIDDRYYEMIRIHGLEKATLIAESETAAINQIETIVREEKIACDFERLDGYLFAGPDTKPEEIEKELKAAHDVGLQDVEQLGETPEEGMKKMCLRFPNQGQFHPLKYLSGVAKAIVENGGEIYAHTRVTEIEEQESPFTLHTADGHIIHATTLVVATNGPINDNAMVFTKQAPYRTFVIGLSIPKGSVQKALFWDMLDPYHYIRTQKDEDDDTRDILVVGGEDHRTGEYNDAEKRYKDVETWARAHFPQCEDVRFQWSGQVLETIDGLAMIGQKPGGNAQSFIITGDSGQGMTHGTIGGMLLTDLITGKKNAWEDVYHPSRLRLGALGKFVQENAETAKDVTMDYLGSADVASMDEVKPGQGATMRKGLTKIALYRDNDGTMYARTAICPHKGCMIRWNDGEKSWDCPCHGSRYNAYGDVLNGPTIKPLPPA